MVLLLINLLQGYEKENLREKSPVFVTKLLTVINMVTLVYVSPV